MANIGSRLMGRVCVVAGVCGAIGEAVAGRFAAEGGIVVGVDRVEHRIGTFPLRADFLDEDQARAVYQRIASEFGGIDVLYNNMGPLDVKDRSALVTSLETWERVIAGNLTATFLSCQYAIPLMLQRDPAKGSVINTASFLSGMGAASAQMAFNAAKAGVAQLSRDLGIQLARSGVRVNALALGPVATPEIVTMFEQIGEEQAARRFTHMPMGRFCTLDELAATAAYLASDDSGFVTATIFPLDGGIAGAFTVPETGPA